MDVAGVAGPLEVVKIGSAAADDARLLDEVASLARETQLVVVVGGAAAIERHYTAIGRPMPTLTLRNGDVVRHCSPSEMSHVVNAYEQDALPRIVERFSRRGVRAFAATAATSRLVRGTRNRPLRASQGLRQRVVRDHHAGIPATVDVERLRHLLTSHAVVCVSPPVWESGSAVPLNVDADMLAAAVARGLGADHLRFVTTTPGILDGGVPPRTVAHIHDDDALPFVRGRMRQKVRAARHALEGPSTVCVTGPSALEAGAAWTWFWRGPRPPRDLELFQHLCALPVRPGSESGLVRVLVGHCAERRLQHEVGPDGELVAIGGDAARTVMLLGVLGESRATGAWATHARGGVAAAFACAAELPDGPPFRVVAVAASLRSLRRRLRAGATRIGGADAAVVLVPGGGLVATPAFRASAAARSLARDLDALGFGGASSRLETEDVVTGACRLAERALLAAEPERETSTADHAAMQAALRRWLTSAARETDARRPHAPVS